MKKGKEELEKQLAEVEDENVRSSEKIERLNDLIARQRATMYANTKEIRRLQDEINNGEHLYERVYNGLKHLFTTKARVTRIREKERKIYFKLIKYRVSGDEISKIERDDGYNGLRKRFAGIMADRRVYLRGAREDRTAEEQAKSDKMFRKKYFRK